ncbi:hypothetical protein [Streptomyces auratus]|uniref:hypothetical protein n=1 Tax=Streptomyces auratus TaxID=114687 RepID=UPI003D1A3E63
MLLLGGAFGEADDEGDGACRGAVCGDLRSVAISRGDAKAGQQPFACLPPQDGE